MVRIKAFPYLRPAYTRIHSIEWLQLFSDSEQVLSERLLHWDPGTSLTIRIIAQIDIEGIWSDCKLASSDVLRLALSWYSQGTGLRGRGSFTDLQQFTGSKSVMLDFTVDGALLANKVLFEIQLVLSNSEKDRFKLAPQRPGSILWSEARTVILEGQGTRFPTELIDFSATQWLPSDAGWFLDWDPNAFDEMTLSGLRLFLNKKNKQVQRAAIESLLADQPVREMIMFDVGRAMITHALENDEFVLHTEDYESGSIGSSIYRLLRTFFPTESMEGLAQRCRHSHARFECDLQDRFKLFKEVS